MAREALLNDELHGMASTAIGKHFLTAGRIWKAEIRILRFNGRRQKKENCEQGSGERAKAREKTSHGLSMASEKGNVA